MKRLFTSTFIVLLFLNSNAQNSSKNQANIPHRFDDYVKGAMKLWKTPGLSVVVVKNKQVVFKKAYGVTEVGKPDAFKTSTLAICASTTKAMTAVCMAMLVDEGKIKWTDKVSDVYPELKLYDNYANNEITIKDLLTHNTGLGNADLLWMYNSNLDTIIHQMRYLKPDYSFRASFIYQNLMYMVAGEVIHKVSGKPWDEFIKERLFTPLGMNHTYPNYKQSVQEKSHITPHWMYDDGVIKPIPFINANTIDAAGGVRSCVDDMDKWMLFMLDSTKINGKKLLQPATYSELFKPQVIVPKSEFYPTMELTKPNWTTYGLGWFQEDYKGKMVNFHTGSLDGAVAILGLIPDSDFGIYIFANMDHTEIRHALMYKAMDLWIFNEDKNDWSKDFYKLYTANAAKEKKQVKQEEEKRIPNTKPSLKLNAYTGTYSNETYGNARIMQQGDSLILKLPADIKVDLIHWNYDTFQGKFERDWMGKSYIQFNLNHQGEVEMFNFLGVTYNKDLKKD